MALQKTCLKKISWGKLSTDERIDMIRHIVDTTPIDEERYKFHEYIRNAIFIHKIICSCGMDATKSRSMCIGCGVRFSQMICGMIERHGNNIIAKSYCVKCINDIVNQTCCCAEDPEVIGKCARCNERICNRCAKPSIDYNTNNTNNNECKYCEECYYFLIYNEFTRRGIDHPDFQK